MILKCQWFIASICYINCYGGDRVPRGDGNLGNSAGSYRFLLNAMMVVVFVGVVVVFVKERVVLTIVVGVYVSVGLVF